MLADHIEGALGGPLTGPALEEIARVMWRALGEGVLSWEEAGRLDGLIRDRQARMRAAGGWGSQGSAGGLLRASGALGGALGAALRRPERPRSPDREASLGRRVVVMLSGAVPSAVARAAQAQGRRLTAAQAAILSVVGREAARGAPTCELPIAQIGALAGAGRSTVQRALRLAEGLGLIRVRQRRRRGARSDTNVVTIEDKAWWRWLKRGPKRAAAGEDGEDEATAPASGGGGCQRRGPTDTEDLSEGKKGSEGAQGAEGAPGEGREGPREGSDPRPAARLGTGGPWEGSGGEG